MATEHNAILENREKLQLSGVTAIDSFDDRAVVLYTNCGQLTTEEKRDSVFRPFVEVHDLTKGDGLGLPICRQMALNMKGELSLDPQYTKGTRFVLDLQA